MKLIRPIHGIKSVTKFNSIDELTETNLLDFFNIILNYGGYLEEFLKKPDIEILKDAPGSSIDQVRTNLNRQLQVCKDFIKIYNLTQDRKNMS